METYDDRKLIEQLKKMLVSRDPNRQLLAVNFIYKTLQKASDKYMYQTLLEYLIKSDMCIYLGEASATLHVELLGRIVCCLRSFLKVPIFYKNSYAAYTTSSLIRATQLYIKEEKKENIVQNILHLLNELFSEIDKNNCASVLSNNSSYDVFQIFNLLITIITKPDVKHETVLFATKLLHTMMSDKNALTKFNHMIIDDVKNILNKYCKHLTKILIDDHKTTDNDYFSCIFGLLCHIGVDALNVCNILKNYAPDTVIRGKLELVEFRKSEIHTQIRSMEEIFNYVHEVLNVLIVKIKDCDKLIDHTAYHIFLNFLKIFLNTSILEETMPAFAENLIRNDFLIFLPSLRARSTDHAFRKLCQINLAELIVILSHKKFNLTKWKGGNEEFRNHIYEGLLENDDDLNTWLQRLFDACSTDSTINSLIIFLYFYCTSPSSSQEVIWKLLPHIVYYILKIPQKAHCPGPIVKCLWLIFAMSSSFGTDISSVKGGKLTIEKTNCKLSKIISVDTNNLYTHHVKIIEWTYSSTRIPFTVQNTVLTIWLENEQDLPPNVLNVAAVWWSLLDIIQNANHTVASTATKLLKYCLDHICEADDANRLKDSLWEMLPNMLTFFIEEDEISNQFTLTCVLELCYNYIPNEPDMDTILKTVFLLTSIIPLFVEKSDDLLFNYMSESFCLINVSLKQQNKIVLSRFINSDVFMETVFDATKSSSNTLSTIAYKILSFSTYYREMYNLEFTKTFTFEPYHIVKCLINENDDEKCSAVLQLIFTSFHARCINSNNRQLVSLIPIYTNEYFYKTYRALYFRLQMICCKESKIQSQSSWQCMNSMLEYCISNDDANILKIVAIQPWTHVTIKYYLSEYKAHRVHHKFLAFVNNWLMCLSKYAGKTISDLTRKGFKNTALLKTVDLFANTFTVDVENQLDQSKRASIRSILRLIGDGKRRDRMQIDFISQ